MLFIFSFILSLRNLCQQNVNGYFFDLTPLSNNAPTIIYSSGYNIYYIALCRSINSSEVNLTDDQTGFSFVRVNNRTSKVDPLVNIFSFEFKLLNPTSPNDGLMYYGYGEPIFIPGTRYSLTTDVMFHFMCDKAANSTSPNFTISFNETTFEVSIMLMASSSFGCPTSTSSPIPTPTITPYPNTLITFRNPDTPEVGVEFDLFDFNGPPNGIRVPLLVSGVDSRILFFQPGERILCPLDLCEENYSSAWLCDLNILTCTSYGVFKSPIDVQLADNSDLDQGVIFKLSSKNGNSLENRIQCSNFIPPGHFYFDKTPVIENNVLHLNSLSTAVCQHPIELPFVNDGNCTFEYNDPKNQSSHYQINLSTLNNGTSGWSKTVMLTGSMSGMGTLIYQPCNYTFCPQDSMCHGDEDSYVWLCKSVDMMQECVGFGLLSYPLKVYLYGNGEGVTVEYHGDDEHIAIFNLICDQSIANGTVVLPNSVFLDGTIMSAKFTASDVCFTSPPTPYPTFLPPIPTPFPTYSPHPSPLPLIVHFNDSYYTLLNLQNADGVLQKRDTLLAYEDFRTPFHFELSYWNLTKFPQNYTNPSQIDQSNFWGCWQDSNNPVCYSLGDKRINVQGQGYDLGDLESGFFIEYYGPHGVNLMIKVDCSEGVPDGIIEFTDHEVLYRKGNNGVVFELTGVGNFACPKAYGASTPTPISNTPTPNPEPIQQWEATSASFNGDNIISVNLEKLQPHSHYVPFLYPDRIERPKIFYSPKSQQECPLGYICNISANANIWECFDLINGQQNVCFPIGDSLYGVSIEIYSFSQQSFENALSESNIPIFLLVTYQGGFYNTTSTIGFTCGEDLSDDQIRFHDSVEQYGDEPNHFRIFAQIKSACPHSSKIARDQSFAGAIFLIVIFVGTILYVACGMFINLIKNKIISLPNSDFWGELGTSIGFAVKFMFCCGKQISGRHDYDNI